MKRVRAEYFCDVCKKPQDDFWKQATNYTGEHLGVCEECADKGYTIQMDFNCATIVKVDDAEPPANANGYLA